MKRVVMLSYPRSGSNLLLSIIRIMMNKHLTLSNAICVSYGQCNTVPCSCENFAFLTKNHDFEKDDVKYSSDFNYIVIIRQDKIANIDAFVRYVKNQIMKNPIKTSEIILTANDIDKEKIMMYNNYYKIFYNKWILNKRDNIFPIFTEDIISEPRKVILKLIEALSVETDDDSVDYYTELLIKKSSFKKENKDAGYQIIKEMIEKV